MIKTVLIADDDAELLRTLEEGIPRCNDSLSVLTAVDGVDAVEHLKANMVSIVVTDLRMPRMDGFSLLVHILEHYPEIPVIVMTGFSTPATERSMWEKGVAGYLTKPVTVPELAERILSILKREADGGTLHGISSGMFLQLVEMEEKTCTIRLFSNSSGKQGILFFEQGELLDARADGLQGEDAAYEIFSWEQVSLSIQNSCPQREKKIGRDLQAILLEAMRLKDERHLRENLPPGREGHSVERAKATLAAQFGEGAGVEDVYEDDAWEGLVQEVRRLSAFLPAGEFQAGYVDRGETCDYIILPGEKPTVVSVSPKCLRDRLLEILSDAT